MTRIDIRPSALLGLDIQTKKLIEAYITLLSNDDRLSYDELTIISNILKENGF